MLIGLLKDAWFYISAGGFLASLVLFVFLLGQYRLAVETEEEEEAEDQQDGPEISAIAEDIEPSLEENSEPTEREEVPLPEFLEKRPTKLAQDLEIPIEVIPTPRESPAIDTINAGEKRMQAVEADLKDVSMEVKLLNTSMANFMGEIKSLEKLIEEQSNKNEEVFERLSELLKNQKSEPLKTAESSPIQEEKVAPEKQENPAPRKIQEEPIPLAQLKLQIPKPDEATVIIEPTTVSGVRKIDSPSKEEKMTLPPVEGKTPVQEKSPSLKGSLKVKDAQNLQTVKEETLSPRKGPVWPI